MAQPGWLEEELEEEWVEPDELDMSVDQGSGGEEDDEWHDGSVGVADALRRSAELGHAPGADFLLSVPNRTVSNGSSTTAVVTPPPSKGTLQGTFQVRENIPHAPITPMAVNGFPGAKKGKLGEQFTRSMFTPLALETMFNPPTPPDDNKKAGARKDGDPELATTPTRPRSQSRSASGPTSKSTPELAASSRGTDPSAPSLPSTVPAHVHVRKSSLPSPLIPLPKQPRHSRLPSNSSSKHSRTQSHPLDPSLSYEDDEPSEDPIPPQPSHSHTPHHTTSQARIEPQDREGSPNEIIESDIPGLAGFNGRAISGNFTFRIASQGSGGPNATSTPVANNNRSAVNATDANASRPPTTYPFFTKFNSFQKNTLAGIVDSIEFKASPESASSLSKSSTSLGAAAQAAFVSREERKHGDDEDRLDERDESIDSEQAMYGRNAKRIKLSAPSSAPGFPPIARFEYPQRAGSRGRFTTSTSSRLPERPAPASMPAPKTSPQRASPKRVDYRLEGKNFMSIMQARRDISGMSSVADDSEMSIASAVGRISLREGEGEQAAQDIRRNRE